MENIEMNQTAVQLLMDWDPLGYGEDAYDTETADVVAALQGIDDAAVLAKVIQEVYELSYEQLIPYEQSEQMAQRLIALKQAAACEI